MAVTQPLLIGVFDSRPAAENAMAQLHNVGFSNEQIFSSSQTPAEHGGIMESLKNFFTGKLSATPSQVASDLSAMGLSNDEAGYYAREYQAGHPIVAVYPGERYREAVELLRNNGAYNNYLSELSNVQGTGYSQTVGAPPTPDYEQPTVEQESEEVRRMKLHKERLGIEKESVPSGEVRLRKEVVEEQKNIEVPVSHEEVIIEHHPAREGKVSDTPVGQEEVIRIPTSEEQVRVTKTPVETGEVSVGKREVLESQPISETVRRERARLEQEGRPDVRGSLDRDDIIDPGTTP